MQIEYERGISNPGNQYRMKKLMARAEAGETLSIGFLGGSITQGCLASAPELCYAYRVFQWWEKTFPQAKFHYINAGIGGTTSHFGTARAESDLLSHKPDFVIIEFSVNDESTEFFRETYEGLVRRVWQDENEPAVMLVHNVYYNNGGNVQIMHGQIARHYQLPAVSMQSSIYPEVVAGRIPNRDITEDDLHPNDKGHELVASVITYALEKIHITQTKDAKPEFPEPLTDNCYEKAVRLDNRNYEPENQGFVKDTRVQEEVKDCFKNGWSAKEKGASLTFAVNGSEIAAQYKRCVTKPAPVALAIVDGDEAHAVTLDANFDETWGDKLQLDTIAEHIEKEKHKVQITITETHETDQLPFYLVSVIASGKEK